MIMGAPQIADIDLTGPLLIEPKGLMPKGR